jgi:hypothetical protein
VSPPLRQHWRYHVRMELTREERPAIYEVEQATWTRSAAKKKTCFFISRIGEPDSEERRFSDKLLKHIIDPVVDELGYEKPIRADHITKPGTITAQVFTHLWSADLVLADLTGANPNVFL